jgi:3-oxoacyl-[acyl-carrier-protein] synthase II
VRRVAVTGIGLATPLGTGTEQTWHSLIEGRSAVGPIAGYDPSSLHTRIAGEMRDFDPEQWANRKVLRSTTRNDQLAIAGAALAVADAGPGPEDGGRAGLFAGSSKETSNLPHILEACLVARTDDGSLDVGRLGEQATSIFYPLYYVEGLQAGSLFYISQAHGLMGANTYFAGTGEASAVAVGRAFRAVRRGEADWALAGGFDDGSSWWNLTKFDPLGVLTTRNDLGAAACRPFDADRDGTVLGEGAAFLVLEPLEAARARGARIYAEVTGFASAFDAGRLLTPDPQGRALELAARAALREAGSTPERVGCVVADGTGTRPGDASEGRALQRLFGRNGGPPASSVKPATGHLLGGAGALNAAVAALALTAGSLPPTLNLARPDPACELDWVVHEARTLEVGEALALSRGFEGQNVALAMRAVE